jgi:glutathione S-transferase
MSNLILHQYTESPFSEKVRALLGFKNATYQQVETSVIMPRDALMPLTGGYRRIPVMQAGADIYCDTALMCKVIDTLYAENTIYPESRQAVVESCALWTDTFFFTVCVAIAFQPASLANEPLFKDEESAAAFMADRAQLSEGSNQLTMPFEIAEPHFISHLTNLDRQLGASDYLFGNEPTIADFSTYHLLWFVDRRPVLQHYFEPFPNVRAWYERIKAFGHGDVETISGEQALSVAAASEPAEIGDPAMPEGFTSGQLVSVMPIDYGFQPVTGELLAASVDQISLARKDNQAGSIVVHFPRMGFQINPVAV